MPRPRARKRTTPRTSTAVRRPTWPTWSGPVGLGALFAALAAWSWRKWPDVFVDFGHELYIPWQLAEGRVLYRDIEYFMGPLSQYFNAAMFVAFGTSLTTLIVVNLTIVALLCAAIVSLFTRAFGRAAGALAGAVFLSVFAFAQYVGIGNYNYVTPYLHEQTHGVALGVLLVLLLHRLSVRPSARTIGAAGAVLGLVFLTKAEAFAPALACSLVAGVLLYRRAPVHLARAAGRAGLFAAAALLPPVVALLLLALALEPADALRAVAGNWIYIFDRTLTVDDPYYAQNLGFAQAGEDGRRMLAALLRLGAFALVALAGEWLVRRRGVPASVVGACVALVLLVTTHWDTWLDVAPVLTVVCAASAWIFVRRSWRARQESERERDFILAMWSVFALVSLAKMLLRPRFEHYGFALAMPGTLLLVIVLVFAVPRALQERGGSGAGWRATSLAAVAAGVSWLVFLSNSYYRLKTLPVGNGGDRFYVFDAQVEPRGRYFLEALEALERQMPGEATLAVLPDGALLNYLLRRPNPTPYYLVTPWEMRAFGGEAAVLSRLTSPTPPDFFVLAKLDMSEYGPRFFGFNPSYGQRTRAWLEENYVSVATVGHEPSLGRPWLRIYRRPEPVRLAITRER